ncbi:MAG: hypothetical protein ACLFQT_03865 [Thiohalophilus sp.]
MTGSLPKANLGETARLIYQTLNQPKRLATPKPVFWFAWIRISRHALPLTPSFAG